MAEFIGREVVDWIGQVPADQRPLGLDPRRIVGVDDAGLAIYGGTGGRTYAYQPPERTRPQARPDDLAYDGSRDIWGSPIAAFRPAPVPDMVEPAGDLAQPIPAEPRSLMGAPVESVWPTGLPVVGNALRGMAAAPLAAAERGMRGDATVGDLLTVAGAAFGGGALGRVPGNALASNALRGARRPPETPAQEVARLLREGRADEVSDDLMARVDPQEMAALYESGATGLPMPMDEASRMARAREMGFYGDLPLYHGTAADFPAFSREHRGRHTQVPTAGVGEWATTSPAVAGNYARAAGEGLEALPPETLASAPGPNVVPLLHRAGRPTTLTLAGRESEGQVANALLDAWDAGHEGVLLRDPITNTPDRIVVHESNQLRSRFARFDPRLRNLGNLSAAGAGAAYLVPGPGNALRDNRGGP